MSKLALLSLVSLSVLAGCQHESPVAPSTPAGLPPSAETGAVGSAAQGTGMQALGIYRVELDPDSLAAVVTQQQLRQGQDNDAVYQLSIDSFLTPQSFQVQSVSRGARGTLELHWRFTHPFRASGTIPRADLGFSGIACFLFDVPSATTFTYFDDGSPMIADSYIAPTADGYYNPAGLLALPGFTANTFPFQTLVDEAGTGNRFNAATGAPISNGGDPAGNFGTVGWQTGSSVDWTGFDILHQGQAVERTLDLSAGWLAATGTRSFLVAILDKYVDPKSGTPGFEHRLPADPPSVLNQFGYREPHGCWDVSQVRFEGETGLLSQNKLSGTTLRFHVRDWDAHATPSSLSDLALAGDPRRVLAGDVGDPQLDLCLPGVLGDATTITALGNTPESDDALFGGDIDADSGMAGDELFYQTPIETPAGSGRSFGPKRGFVRVTDVVPSTAPYEIPLHPDLTPLTGDFPRNVTYQVVEVLVRKVGGAVTAGWANPLPGPGNEQVNALAVDSLNRMTIAGVFNTDINVGGELYTSAGDTDGFIAQLDTNGTFLWSRTVSTSGIDRITDVAIDENDNIYISGSVGAAVQFDPTSPVLPYEGDVDMFLLRLYSDGSYYAGDTWGSPARDVMAGVDINAAGGVRATGAIGGEIEFGFDLLAPTGLTDAVVLQVTPLLGINGGTVLKSGFWSEPYGIATLDNGDAVIAGYFQTSIDFTGGSELASGGSDLFVASYHFPGASLNWHHLLGTPNYDAGTGVAANAGNQAALAGLVSGTVDLGLGARSFTDGYTSVILVNYDETGAPLWDSYLTSPDTNVGFPVLARDRRGLIYDNFYLLAGNSGAVLTPDGPITAATGGGFQDILLLNISSVGERQFYRQVASPMTEVPLCAAFGISGEAIFGGLYAGDLDFDPGPGISILSPEGGVDGYITKIPGDGNW